MQAKDVYFANNSVLLKLKEERRINLRSDIELANERVVSLEAKIQHAEKDARDAAEKQSELVITPLRLENRKPKERLSEERDLSIELTALRNYFFDLQNDVPDETIIAKEPDETPVRERILCVGGRESMHRELRQYLPNAILLRLLALSHILTLRFCRM